MPPLGNLRGFHLLDQERRPLFQTISRTCVVTASRLAWRPHRGRSLRGHQTGTLGAFFLDDRKLPAAFVVVEDAMLSLSMKRTPWTSQLS